MQVGILAFISRDRIEALHDELQDIIDKEAWPLHCNMGMATSVTGRGTLLVFIQSAGLPEHWDRVAKKKVEELLSKYTVKGLYDMKSVSAIDEIAKKSFNK